MFWRRWQKHIYFERFFYRFYTNQIDLACFLLALQTHLIWGESRCTISALLFLDLFCLVFTEVFLSIRTIRFIHQNSKHNQMYLECLHNMIWTELSIKNSNGISHWSYQAANTILMIMLKLSVRFLLKMQIWCVDSVLLLHNVYTLHIIEANK